ncbi:unnamed protein product, partial [Tetraodon nigroviridis]
VSYEVPNLRAYTDYICKICVYYNSAFVNSSNVAIKTKPGKPDEPQSLSLHVKERNRIKVKWNKPKDFHGPEVGYTVRLFEGGTIKNTKNTKKTTLEFEDLSYSTEYQVKVGIGRPRIIPCLNHYNEKPLIGFLVFLIILTSLALLFVTYKIYILKREKSRDSSESMNLIPKTSECFIWICCCCVKQTGAQLCVCVGPLWDVKASFWRSQSPRRAVPKRSVVAGWVVAGHEDKLMSVEPLTAETLLDAYKRKIADEGRLFLAEFQTIPRIFSKYPVKEAKKFHNGPKNRYVDILPYDYNRVQLTTGNGSPGCDYINASFINGFKESKKYIAAQEEGQGRGEGGDPHPVCELARPRRSRRGPPPPETEAPSELFQELLQRSHRHPLQARHRTHTHRPEGRAGVGRTGTFIGIDAMMESLEVEGRADIYGYVVMLRRQRCLMVQVEVRSRCAACVSQYILIHQALLEHTQFGETESPLQELHSTLSTLKQRTADNESTLMEDEFDVRNLFLAPRLRGNV